MYQPLVPCPSCARHVLTTEARCPFCSSELPGDLASGAVPAATGRLGRAAAFVFGASMAVTACGAEVSPGATSGQGGEGAESDGGPGDDGGGQAQDGGPPPMDAGVDAPPDDDGGVQALYGDPPPRDAGETEDGGGGQPIYGAPPPPPKEG